MSDLFPNNLRAGDIVRDHNVIGIVRGDPAKTGDRGWFAPGMCVDDVEILHLDSHSCTTVTNNHHRRWEVIPENERTHEQRLAAFGATWKGDANLQEGDDPYEWAILRCLLTDDDFEGLYPDNEWPDAIALARAVARKLDGFNNLNTVRERLLDIDDRLSDV